MRVKAYEGRGPGNLRPPAKQAGVQIADGQRFGPHNLRRSKIQTTLDLYTQETVRNAGGAGRISLGREDECDD